MPDNNLHAQTPPARDGEDVTVDGDRTAGPTPRTAKQLEASRKNGAKSRGPLTEQTRLKSAQNARKHNLTSKTPPPGSALMAARDEFYDSLVKDLRPSNKLVEGVMKSLAWKSVQMARAEAMQADLYDPRKRPPLFEEMPAPVRKGTIEEEIRLLRYVRTCMERAELPSLNPGEREVVGTAVQRAFAYFVNLHVSRVDSKQFGAKDEEPTREECFAANMDANRKGMKTEIDQYLEGKLRKLDDRYTALFNKALAISKRLNWSDEERARAAEVETFAANREEIEQIDDRKRRIRKAQSADLDFLIKWRKLSGTASEPEGRGRKRKGKQK